MSRRYLNLTPLSEALAMLRREFSSPGRAETVPLAEAVGRVTAEPCMRGGIPFPWPISRSSTGTR
ncbi:hypothetical protein [Methanoculleus chikugoensis]|uniref:hypothetical protein n=1 Tax=Methanoculleus chikugoensis TaxID=118126 RepID=UPI000A81D265|nr:hypothetical protein [Methanoculleus chikugoensis]